MQHFNWMHRWQDNRPGTRLWSKRHDPHWFRHWHGLDWIGISDGNVTVADCLHTGNNNYNHHPGGPSRGTVYSGQIRPIIIHRECDNILQCDWWAGWLTWLDEISWRCLALFGLVQHDDHWDTIYCDHYKERFNVWGYQNVIKGNCDWGNSMI